MVFRNVSREGLYRSRFLPMANYRVIRIIFGRLRNTVPRQMVKGSSVVGVFPALRVVVRPITMRLVISAIIRVGRRQSLHLGNATYPSAKASGSYGVIVVQLWSLQPRRSINRFITRLSRYRVSANFRCFTREVLNGLVGYLFRLIHVGVFPYL